MSFLTTSAASIHQLGAATAVARRSDETPGWTRSDTIGNAMLAGGWLIEQHTLRTHRELDTATEAAVRGKDIAVAGAMLTSVANLIVTGLMKRGAPAAAERYRLYFRLMRPLNRALAATAIGLTPRVNFNILRSYRPGTAYRLFT